MGRGDAADLVEETMGESVPRGQQTNESESRRAISLRGPVQEVQCTRADGFDEEWSCTIDDMSQGYSGREVRFDNLDLRGAEVEEFMSDDGNEMFVFEYNSADCEVVHQPIQEVNQERTLVCEP